MRNVNADTIRKETKTVHRLVNLQGSIFLLSIHFNNILSASFSNKSKS